MGIYLTFKQDMKLWGLWIGLTVALTFAGSIGGLIVMRADWDHEVKKVVERLENDGNADDDDVSAESV